MTAVEARTIRGVLYIEDALGWVWRNNPNARAGEPHWVRMPPNITLDRLASLR